jgi:hypothetical protein
MSSRRETFQPSPRARLRNHTTVLSSRRSVRRRPPDSHDQNTIRPTRCVELKSLSTASSTFATAAFLQAVTNQILDDLVALSAGVTIVGDFPRAAVSPPRSQPRIRTPSDSMAHRVPIEPEIDLHACAARRPIGGRGVSTLRTRWVSRGPRHPRTQARRPARYRSGDTRSPPQVEAFRDDMSSHLGHGVGAGGSVTRPPKPSSSRTTLAKTSVICSITRAIRSGVETQTRLSTSRLNVNSIVLRRTSGACSIPVRPDSKRSFEKSRCAPKRRTPPTSSRSGPRQSNAMMARARTRRSRFNRRLVVCARRAVAAADSCP